MVWFKKSFKGKVLGLIAGGGDFPLQFAENAKKNGQRLVIFGVKGHTKPAVTEYADAAYFMDLGAVGDLVRYLKESGIKQVVLAGSVPKKEMYNPQFEADTITKEIINAPSNRGDDHMLRAFEIFLKLRCGVSVLYSRLFMKGMLAEPGVMTECAPSAEEWKDLRFGLQIARKTGRMDIGQSVVVKGAVVLAVEAIEGTDEAIRRGAALGRGGVVVVKVPKPNQDLRFDLPCVGPDTIQTMITHGARVLGLEAGRTLMIHKEDLLKTANEACMAIVGF